MASTITFTPEIFSTRTSVPLGMTTSWALRADQICPATFTWPVPLRLSICSVTTAVWPMTRSALVAAWLVYKKRANTGRARARVTPDRARKTTT